MNHDKKSSIGFTRPGGEAPVSDGPRPFDLAHLSRQTLGDRALEEEVLALFRRQAIFVRDQMPTADAGERRLLAHGLKGAARGVGAFVVAERADELEREPASEPAVEALRLSIDEACDYIASICR